MPLTPGALLGPYEILALIGAGGMGEVYRARDTRLNRTVAIKVLPAHASHDPEMKQRFEREAQAVAALNHPHICTLHDIGQHEGVDYLVMEHLDGETLDAQITRGALPMDQALRIAIEVADALAKAHGQGVVHRDVKPSNIMVTKASAKLLDFGLARLTPPSVQVTSVSTIPTRADATAQGAILGTLQYMAPEQLEGREADARTDHFALGAVLYEMLTGRKAFEGTSQASLIGAILKDTPKPVSSWISIAPPALDHLVRTCLEKDPDHRWQVASDIVTQLKWIAAGGADARPAAAVTDSTWGSGRTLIVAATLVVLFGAMVLLLRQRPPVAQAGEMRFQITDPGSVAGAWYRVSPDGSAVLFRSTVNGTSRLYLRPIDSVTGQFLPGTEGAEEPAFSPNGRSIVFFTAGKIRRLDFAGGAPQVLCDAPYTDGIAWSRAGMITFSISGKLFHVPETGGVLAELPADDARFFPNFLPDGKHYVYYVSASRALYIGSVDSKESRKIVDATSEGIYAEPGYLLFQRAGTLLAQAFDARTRELKAEPVRIADGLIQSGAPAAFGVSENGVVTFRTDGDVRRRFEWLDRTGASQGFVGDAGLYQNGFDLSPDGEAIAVTMTVSGGARGDRDIWVLEWRRQALRRVTTDSGQSGLACSGNRMAGALRSAGVAGPTMCSQPTAAASAAKRP